MSFLRWFAREGFRTLKYVFRGIFRSLLRYVPCTMHPPLFSHPLRVNGMAGVSLAPMPPRHCAENGRCAVCSTPASSGGPGRTHPPVSTCPLAALFVPSMGFPLRGHANVVQKRSWCFYPEDRSWMRTGVLVPWPSRCDILAKGFSAAEWSAWNKQKKCGSPFSDPH
jgi:hypothetical protein